MLLLNSRVPGSFEGSFDEKRPKFSTKVLTLAHPERLVRKLWMYSKNSEYGDNKGDMIVIMGAIPVGCINRFFVFIVLV